MNTTPEISIQIAPLGTPDWDSVRAIRYQVFVVEQQVDEAEEYDEFEPTARHFLAFVQGTPAGTCRWRETEKGFKLERFAVLPEFRNQGVGAALVERALAETHPLATEKSKPIYLHAQVQALPFYAKLGFRAFGPEFTEADIKHRAMKYGHHVE